MLTQAHDLIRKRCVIESRHANKIVVDGRLLTNFSSNDYLGLATHPKVIQSFIKSVQDDGAGSASSALLSGFYRPHLMLEEKFSEFLNRDKSILFNSGYMANIGVIAALVKRHGIVYADKLCHASILDGIQLSRAKCIRYLHNDIAHLTANLRQSSENQLLISESIFSMEGDISPIAELASMAALNKLCLMVDDAHGAGVLGESGGGICEHLGLTQQQVPCLVVPLGKAFASMGAIVSGSHDLINYLIQVAKTYRYTTALPPAVACATLAALHIVEQENWRRMKLQALIAYFIQQANCRSLPLVSEDSTPIKCVMVGSNQLALNMQNALRDNGFYISCVRPPTVPAGTARIRISLNCLHDEADIEKMLDLLAALYEKSK